MENAEAIKLAETAYKDAWTALRNSQTNYKDQRKKFLNMLEKRAEENKLDDICAVLKTIHKAEDTTKAFAKIGSTLNPKIISQLDHLLITTDDGTLNEITDSNAIFQNLLQRGLHDLS